MKTTYTLWEELKGKETLYKLFRTYKYAGYDAEVVDIGLRYKNDPFVTFKIYVNFNTQKFGTTTNVK